MEFRPKFEHWIFKLVLRINHFGKRFSLTPIRPLSDIQRTQEIGLKKNK